MTRHTSFTRDPYAARKNTVDTSADAARQLDRELRCDRNGEIKTERVAPANELQRGIE
jgi:hypothetical protein